MLPTPTFDKEPFKTGSGGEIASGFYSPFSKTSFSVIIIVSPCVLLWLSW